MDNQAFDEALRRITAEEDLPYSPETWRRVSARLDAHEGKSRKVIALVPALRWAAAAMVIGLALAAGWMLRGEKEASGRMDAPVTQYSADGIAQAEKVAGSAVQTPVENPRPYTTPSANNYPARGTAATAGRNGKSSGSIAQPHISSAPEATPEIAGTPIAATPPVAVGPAEEREEPAHPRPLQTPRTAGIGPANNDADPAPRASRERTGFDVAGGFGSGTQRSTFALGVAVKKSLSDRLQFEGGLAVVSAASIKMPGAKNENGLSFTGLDTAGLSPAMSQTTEEEETRVAFAYLQASPTLSYRIYKGFSAGGGIDAQRLLASARQAITQTFDASGIETAAPQPEWDFGVAARADYNVSNRLRLGVLYRESIRATNSRSTRKAAGRDYFLVRLSYALF